MEADHRFGPAEYQIKEEVSFVTTSLNRFGFVPEKEGIIACRGDSRSPEELIEAGGFFRKAFGDPSKVPSFRVDGGVRNMIGLSKDITVAMGFARYNVNVQKAEEKPHTEGWVYVMYLASGHYYDPTEYPYAFLADWGREVDAIYVPMEHIIGAIKVSSTDNSCIHCYLTRIVQEMHAIRGCTTPYLDQLTIDIHALWRNPALSVHVSKELYTPHFDQLTKLYDTKKLIISLNADDTTEALRITDKYRDYFQRCSPFSQPDKELTAILAPTVGIQHMPELL